MVIGFVLTSLFSSAQLNDVNRVVGTWQLDSIVAEDIDPKDYEVMK